MTRSSRTIIGSLRAGEPVPAGEPRRYRNGSGYVRLRWKTGPRQYVEVYEHRVMDGYVTTAEEVHHRNHHRDDNRPENLEHLTSEEHDDRHASPRRHEVIRRYLAGESTPAIATALDCDASALTRLLERAGVPRRPPMAAVADLDIVLARHAEGARVAVIARELGCHRSNVDRALDQLGLPHFPPGRPPSDSKHANPAEAVRRGLTTRRSQERS